MKRITLALLIILLLCPKLQAQAPFYQGKIVRIVVGFTPGGFYDRWARLLARYMPKYIPGNPEIIVQNMPGAGGLIAANHVYVGKPDGLLLGALGYGIYLDQLVGRNEVKYDVTKFHWLGSPERSDQLIYMRADAPYKSIEDMQKASEPPKCGSTGTAGTDYILARLLEEAFPPLKIQTVTGYPGGSEIDIAVERGEVMCRGMTSAPFFGREPFHSWRKKGFVRVLLVTNQKRDPRAPEAPTIYELFRQQKTPEETRRAADVIIRGGDFGRPLVAPPGAPSERVNTLRNAMANALKDSDLLGEANKGKMEVEPASGEELQELAARMLAQPPGVIARVKKILGN
ncbi:MAG: Bug family tripartite tricarboxylate transporter substrate binding protein [Candidatus Binatia bacterium]